MEAEANRVMAMSAPDYKDAMHHLKAAEHALDEGHAMSKSDREEERALVLETGRETGCQNSRWMRPRRPCTTGIDGGGEPQPGRSRLLITRRRERCSSEQGKYAEAIPHLEEDTENPESMVLLVEGIPADWRAAEDARLLAREAGKHE